MPEAPTHGATDALANALRRRVAGQLLQRLLHNRSARLGLLQCGVIVVLALAAGVLAGHDPDAQAHAAILLPPAWMAGGSRDYLLGTDMLARLLHGARLSLLIGALVVTLSSVIGITLGMLAGFYHGRWVDHLCMRVVDVMLAIPSLLLAIAVVAILGPGLLHAVLAIAVVNLPGVIRLARAAALSQVDKDYVLASRLAGASQLRLLLVTLLPNCLPPLIVQATLGFSTAILDAAALGFLGLGAQPPTAEWGSMLADSMQFLQSAWWVVTLPGIAVLLTVLGFNLLGDGLRDALDPRLERG